MEEKPFMITTAINYTNGPPHIGHFIEALLADILARYHRFMGNHVFFLTGTDEHGIKIEKKAKTESLTPKELCDKYVEQFQLLNFQSDISYDYFIRTTDPKHMNFAVEFFQKCMEKGDIYLGEYEGYYDIKEECYVSETEALEWNYKNLITGLPLIKIKEPSYFFTLSQFQKKLLKWQLQVVLMA